jgi:transcriptional regulator with XRE-family HTH domain
MNPAELKQARERRGYTQQDAAAHLGVSQAYLSMLENGGRKPSSRLARKLVREYGVSPTVLPLSDAPLNLSPDSLVRELASLGYPGFSHFRRPIRKVNPAKFLLSALGQNNLEARVVEALPWLVFRYPDMDFDWLVPQARLKNLQNRLGFCVTLARQAGRRDDLSNAEQELETSKLAREDSFRELNEPERRWLREHRSEQARQWNLLSDLTPETLRYVNQA